MKITHRKIMKVYHRLLTYFGPQQWWPAKTEFEILIGAILTQNTQWQNVEKALCNLSEHLEPNNLLTLSEQKLAELIRPSAYYNQKIARLLGFTQWLTDNFNSIEHAKHLDMNNLRESLLALKGIGPETANAMLVYVFEKPVFIIDAYTRRIFMRLGYTIPHAYDAFRLQIERALGKHFPLRNEFHALLVIEAKE